MTRKPYTNQEAFDVAARHLLTQGRRSMNPDSSSCAYRGVDGTKCAVGALIDDADYVTEMDRSADGDYGFGIKCATMSRLMPACLRSVDIDLLAKLQSVHDGAANEKTFIRVVAADLRKVARRFDLSPAVLDEVRT